MIKKIYFLVVFMFTICQVYSQVGIGTTNPNDDLDVVGDAQISGALKVGNPTITPTTKRASKTFFSNTTIVQYNGYSGYQSFSGSLDIPSGAGSITVTAITFNAGAYDNDGDEESQIRIEIGGYETSLSVPTTGFYGKSDWNFVNDDLNWSFSSNQTVRFRVWDENGWSDDYFRLENIEVTVFYEYTSSIQTGQIIAEGRIYANNNEEMGDLAEHFELNTNIFEQGMIVSLIAGSENEYELSKASNDQFMIGVISKNPSVVLNKSSVGPPVAMVGRVKVKLVQSNSLIKSGDYLTSSTINGRAQKAKNPGPVIGFAVTNQVEGEDWVEIIVQPGKFYYPNFEVNK